MFYIKRNIRPVKCTKKITDLLRKCCYLRYKYGYIIVPLVTFAKGLDSTQWRNVKHRKVLYKSTNLVVLVSLVPKRFVETGRYVYYSFKFYLKNYHSYDSCIL